jgi:hypothetical protein
MVVVARSVAQGTRRMLQSVCQQPRAHKIVSAMLLGPTCYSRETTTRSSFLWSSISTSLPLASGASDSRTISSRSMPSSSSAVRARFGTRFLANLQDAARDGHRRSRLSIAALEYRTFRSAMARASCAIRRSSRSFPENFTSQLNSLGSSAIPGRLGLALNRLNTAAPATGRRGCGSHWPPRGRAHHGP